jgi:hypothetical protein
MAEAFVREWGVPSAVVSVSETGKLWRSVLL